MPTNTPHSRDRDDVSLTFFAYCSSDTHAPSHIIPPVHFETCTAFLFVVALTGFMHTSDTLHSYCSFVGVGRILNERLLKGFSSVLGSFTEPLCFIAHGLQLKAMATARSKTLDPLAHTSCLLLSVMQASCTYTFSCLEISADSTYND